MKPPDKQCNLSFSFLFGKNRLPHEIKRVEVKWGKKFPSKATEPKTEADFKPLRQLKNHILRKMYKSVKFLGAKDVSHFSTVSFTPCFVTRYLILLI